MIGETIAHYQITAHIGAGGMGEVYRARDTKLGRDVALKVLPEAFASDAERMARFEREAKVLASLNHPNIAAIYGFEESSGAGFPARAPLRALVMELVEGPTLADRIAQGPIPLDEALPIAKQICEALEYAHERGIVHRDLKPANVKITPEGMVKLLDFGLAKALEGDSFSGDMSNSPTISRMATQAGIILGTPGTTTRPATAPIALSTMKWAVPLRRAGAAVLRPQGSPILYPNEFQLDNQRRKTSDFGTPKLLVSRVGKSSVYSGCPS